MLKKLVCCGSDIFFLFEAFKKKIFKCRADSHWQRWVIFHDNAIDCCLLCHLKVWWVTRQKFCLNNCAMCSFFLVCADFIYHSKYNKPMMVIPKLQISHAVVGGCIWMISGATIYCVFLLLLLLLK